MKSTVRSYGALPGIALAGLLLLPRSGAAQIDVSFQLHQRRVLSDEAVRATLVIRNDLNEPLRIGAEGAPAELHFYARGAGQRMVSRVPDARPPVLIVPARASLTNEWNLSQRFDLAASGSYTLGAYVEWRGITFPSNPARLEVLRGIELTRTSAAFRNGAEMRRLSLWRLEREERIHLLLKIEDLEGTLCHAVQDVGRFLPMDDPILRVDGADRIHVLSRSGPSRFVHTLFGRDGRQLERHTFDASGRPTLVEDPQQGFRVHGVRRLFE